MKTICMINRDGWRICLGCLGLWICLGLSSPAQADPVTDYNVAVEFYKQKRWDLAADACADFLKRNADHERAPAVRLYWAQALLHLRKYQEARDQYRLFLRGAANHPDRPLAMYRTGECSFFLNDPAAAEAELQQFLQSYPNHELASWATVYLGESQLRQKKYEPALRSFESYLTRFPNGNLLDDAEMGLAATLEGLNQKDRAVEVYQRIVARPQSSRAADALFNLAAFQFDSHNFEQSAKLFQQIAEKYPKHRLVSAAHLNAGYAFYYLSQFQEAIAEFEKAVTDPAHAEAAGYWIGLSRKSRGEFAPAAEQFSQALTKSPQGPYAEKLTFHWADAEYRWGHSEKAIELFRSVGEKWPNGELADDSLHSACEVALQAGDLKQAAELHQEFLKRYPKSGLLQVQELLAGRLYIAQADAAGPQTEAGQQALKQSSALLQHVIESSTLDSTRNFARYQLARVAERQGRDADVLTELKPILETATDQHSQDYLDALLLSANAQLRLKETATALSTFRQYLKLAQTETQKLAGFEGLTYSLASTQKWPELETALTEFAQFDSKNARFAQVALAVGESAFDQRAWGPAAACFQKVLAQGIETPYAFPALSGLGHAEYEQKNYKPAAETFEKLAALATADRLLASHARFMQALAQQQAGELKEALATYQQAGELFTQTMLMRPLEETDFEIGRNAYRSFKGGARVARELEDIATAEKLYDAAYRELKLQPQAEQTELDLLINEWADLSYNAKNFHRSDELYSLLVKERPESPLADDARLILAESLRFGGKKEQAVAAFEELIESPLSDEFVQQRAMTHLLDLLAEAKKWPEVVKLAEQMEKKFPVSPQALYAAYRRGEGELQAKQYPAAILSLQRVRDELSKDLGQAPAWWPEAWLLLAEAEFLQKDYTKMEAALEDLATKAPKSPLLYRADALRGRSFENQARFPESRAAYQRVIDSESGRGTETAAEAQFRIAESYLKENNLPVALREYYKVYAGYQAARYQAAALFQAAACDVSMKHFPEAAETYRKLIAEFPESEFAKTAQTRLQDLEPATEK